MFQNMLQTMKAMISSGQFFESVVHWRICFKTFVLLAVMSNSCHWDVPSNTMPMFCASQRLVGELIMKAIAYDEIVRKSMAQDGSERTSRY